MSNADFLGLLGLLARHDALLSAVLLALLLLRPGLQRAGGPRAVHASWAALPLTLLALHLPGPTAHVPATAVELIRAAGQSAREGTAVLSAPGSAWPAALAAVWALGAVILMGLQWQGHRRLLLQLDRQSQPWRSAVGCSPALLGLWRPRLVLPQDFEQRFTSAEQSMVIAHEQVHARRGDNAWTLLARLLVCLHWFNPLAWWALHRFTRDQELACDALVLQEMSNASASIAPYANALLKCSYRPVDAAPWPALATSWHNTHPVKERILMLTTHTRSTPKAWRHRLMATLCTVLLAGSAYALQADDAAPVELRLEIHDGGQRLGQPRLLVQDGHNAAIDLQPDPASPGSRHLRIGITPRALTGGRYQLSLQLAQGDPLTPWAQPVLIVNQDQPGRIEIGDVDRILRIDVQAGRVKSATPTSTPGTASVPKAQ